MEIGWDALDQYQKRKVDNADKPKVEGAWYCRLCGGTAPFEYHKNRPIVICEPCDILHKNGLI